MNLGAALDGEAVWIRITGLVLGTLRLVAAEAWRSAGHGVPARSERSASSTP